MVPDELAQGRHGDVDGVVAGGLQVAPDRLYHFVACEHAVTVVDQEAEKPEETRRKLFLDLAMLNSPAFKIDEPIIDGDIAHA